MNNRSSFLFESLGHNRLRSVLSLYNTCDRQYHNTQHIIQMFDIADAYKMELTHAQQLAILFHDVIYVPGSQHNEEISSTFLRNLCVKSIEIETIWSACGMIEKTINHIASDTDSEETLEFLDLDLYRLASDYPSFLKYNLMIYHEYYPVLKYKYPLETQNSLWNKFQEGRKMFFEDFLRRHGNIFNSKMFSYLNPIAKDNINRYLEKK